VQSLVVNPGGVNDPTKPEGLSSFVSNTAPSTTIFPSESVILIPPSVL